MRNLGQPDAKHRDAVLGEVWEKVFHRDTEVKHTLCLAMPASRADALALVARLNLPGQEDGILSAPNGAYLSSVWRWVRPYRPEERDDVVARAQGQRSQFATP